MKVTANFATYLNPERWSCLRQAIESIRDQVDLVRVCLNGYQAVPKELKLKRVDAFIPEEDLGASGKFFWSCCLNEYYFTVDDDIIYPTDYVAVYLEKLKSYDERVVITTHGSILKPGARNYFSDRQVFHFCESQAIDRRVDIGGTGVMAFNTNIFRPRRKDFLHKNAADLSVAHAARKNKIPIISISHPKGWLKGVKVEESIFENRDEPSLQAARLKLVKALSVKSNYGSERESRLSATSPKPFIQKLSKRLRQTIDKTTEARQTPRGPGEHPFLLRDWMLRKTTKAASIRSFFCLFYFRSLHRFGFSRIIWAEKFFKSLSFPPLDSRAHKVPLLKFFIQGQPLYLSLADHRSLKVPSDFLAALADDSVLRARLGPGDTFIDIGANQGGLSLAAGQIVGSSGQVVAIEPSPWSGQALKENLLGLSAKTLLHQVALSDEETVFYFNVPTHSVDAATLARWFDLPTKIAIQVTTADSLLENVHANQRCLLRVDVGGGELAFLRGARETLNRLGSPPLLMSVMPTQIFASGATLRDILDELAKIGYTKGYDVGDDFIRSEKGWAIEALQIDGPRNLIFE